MTEKTNNEFLDAEAAVQSLIRRLEKVGERIEEYESASSQLSVTKQSLDELVQKASQITGATLSATRALEEVGTPEILQELAKTTTSVSALTGDLESVRVSLDAVMTQQQGAMGEIQALAELLRELGVSQVAALIDSTHSTRRTTWLAGMLVVLAIVAATASIRLGWPPIE